MQKCRNCNEQKPEHVFVKRGSVCPECKKYRRLKEILRARLKHFNKDEYWFFEQLKIQNNNCAICNNPEKALNVSKTGTRLLCVDHNHDTQKLRGLLCINCNAALGLLKENNEIISNAINYLEKYEKMPRL